MWRIRFGGFLIFCALALPIKMGMDGKLDRASGSQYLALAIVELVLLILPAGLLIFFGTRAVNRNARVIRAARSGIDSSGYINVAELSRELSLKESRVRSALDSARRRGVLPAKVEIK